MKLWQKENTSTSELIEKFTVGRDKEFDLLLAKYDVQGSIAHVTMLGEVGLMTKDESAKAIEALKQIETEIDNKQFKIDEDIEDVHSRVSIDRRCAGGGSQGAWRGRKDFTGEKDEERLTG